MSINPSARVIGTVDPSLLAREMTIALGSRKDDKQWRNIPGTLGDLLSLLTKHEVGEKDGRCLIQGSLSGATRVKKNVVDNYLVIVDIDTGEPIDSIVSLIQDAGLFAVITTTFNHMKAESTIAEAALLRYCKDHGIAQEHAITDAADYLRKEKMYAPSIVFTDVKREMRDGGVQFVVKHDPMPRLRITFVLDQPFDFANRGGSQADAMDEWSDRYAGFCEKLQIPYDKSCTDPSRLFYLPRHPRGAAALSQCIVIAGEPLTIDRMPRAKGDKDNDPIAAFENIAGNDSKVFKTANIKKFMATAAPFFEAATWLESVDPDGVRGSAGSGGNEHACPNEANHSEQKADDRAFWVRNASDADGDGGFVMHCGHATCKSMSDNDRAWYLDRACEAHGVTDAMQLREFCEGLPAEEAAAEKAAEVLAATPNALEDHIAAVTEDTPRAEVREIIRAIAEVKDTLDADAHVTALVARSGLGKRAINKTMTEFRQAAEARASSSLPPPPAVERGPADIETYDGGIMPQWEDQAKNAVTLKLLSRKCGREATVFNRLEGGAVTLRETSRGKQLSPIRSLVQWGSLLTDSIPFFTLDEDTGELLRSNADKNVVGYVTGLPHVPLPYIDRVVRVPVLGLDDNLLHEPGYDASLRVYYDPQIEFLPVPEDITPEHIDEACEWLIESIRDFPFTDKFDGSDALPIKLEEKDADGWRLPNLERGRSSRVNFLAMLLQPFVRAHINGPTPAYHFDKAAAGTGAGYLANVVATIVTGQSAKAQTMAESEEEFRKTITATLRSGSDIIFIDNIGRDVVSSHLAAALTANIWTDRVLGVSETCEIEVRSMWILAGNNTAFTSELLRRNVPIRMDANTPNPATDRGEGAFKHVPNDVWVLENRPKLVWALHVLIMNWVQKGKPKGSVFFNSFDGWASVVGGILEAAEITGFLGNRADYIRDKNDEDDTGTRSIQRLYDTFKTESMGLREVCDILDNDIQGNLMSDIGIDPTMKGDKVRALGKIFSTQYAAKTFQILDGNNPKKVKLVKQRSRDGVVYSFISAE